MSSFRRVFHDDTIDNDDAGDDEHTRMISNGGSGGGKGKMAAAACTCNVRTYSAVVLTVLLIMQLVSWLSVGIVVWLQYDSFIKPMWNATQRVLVVVDEILPQISPIVSSTNEFLAAATPIAIQVNDVLPNVLPVIVNVSSALPQYLHQYEYALGQLNGISALVAQIESVVPAAVAQYTKCTPLLNEFC